MSRKTRRTGELAQYLSWWWERMVRQWEEESRRQAAERRELEEWAARVIASPPPPPPRMVAVEHNATASIYTAQQEMDRDYLRTVYSSSLGIFPDNDHLDRVIDRLVGVPPRRNAGIKYGQPWQALSAWKENRPWT